MQKALPPHLGSTWKPQGDGEQFTAEEVEFLRACERERERLHVRFLKATDYFRVMRKLGYDKVSK